MHRKRIVDFGPHHFHCKVTYSRACTLAWSRLTFCCLTAQNKENLTPPVDFANGTESNGSNCDSKKVVCDTLSLHFQSKTLRNPTPFLSAWARNCMKMQKMDCFQLLKCHSLLVFLNICGFFDCGLKLKTSSLTLGNYDWQYWLLIH